MPPPALTGVGPCGAGPPVPWRWRPSDLPADSADAVLSTWTLCSIPDVGTALAEIRRLLEPGGLLHFVEHGISPDPKVARRQGRIEPVNKAIFGGCHLTRDIPEVITDAGFTIDTISVFQHPKEPKVFGWTLEGRAGPSTSVHWRRVVVPTLRVGWYHPLGPGLPISCGSHRQSDGETDHREPRVPWKRSG